MDEGPQVEAIEKITTKTAIAICVSSTIALLVLCLTLYYCLIHRKRSYHSKLSPLGDVTLPRRPPSAVKSPSSQPPAPHYVRKTPVSSPTDNSANSADEKNEKNEKKDKKVLPVLDLESETEKVKEKVEEERSMDEKNEEHEGEGLGQLVFKLRYKQDKHALVVTVVKCKSLPLKSPLTSCDPYVKLQLLPEKQDKVKTRVLRKTRNPVYDEEFTFYGIDLQQLQAITLHFVVLSFDSYSRDDIIGEVFYPINSCDVAQISHQQVALIQNIQPRSLKIKSQGRGELLVSLCYQPAANRLTVVILKARNLPRMDVTGLADPYVKMYLLVDGQRIAKKKTHVKKRTLNPVFNESFVFDIPNNGAGLQAVSLEFMVLDWDRVTKNEVIGRLELGGPKSCGSALTHWTEVCNSPRRQIADWHKLRE